MPPKVTFTKEEVLEAAYLLVVEIGINELSARNVASALNSSTAPVYSSFESMEELRHAIIRKAKGVLIKYTRNPYSERPILNIGIGICVFARDHKNLYDMIFLGKKGYSEIYFEYITMIVEYMKLDFRFVEIDPEERDLLLNQLWTYTFGLATMISIGLLEDMTDEKIKINLFTAGTSLVNDTWMASVFKIENL